MGSRGWSSDRGMDVLEMTDRTRRSTCNDHTATSEIDHVNQSCGSHLLLVLDSRVVGHNLLVPYLYVYRTFLHLSIYVQHANGYQTS